MDLQISAGPDIPCRLKKRLPHWVNFTAILPRKLSGLLLVSRLFPSEGRLTASQPNKVDRIHRVEMTITENLIPCRRLCIPRCCQNEKINHTSMGKSNGKNIIQKWMPRV